MLGATTSIAGPNIILNTIVAESLCGFADILEKSSDFKKDLHSLVADMIKRHKRIIFNGNNYSDEWVSEAERCGLLNLKTTVDARPMFITPKNIELFVKHGVYTESEMHSRYEIQMENYCKTLHIEALTMVDMVKEAVIPTCVDYQNELAKLLGQKKACGEYDVSLEEYLLSSISKLCSCLLKQLTVLENALLESKDDRKILAQASFYRDKIFTAMSELRLIVDELETLVARKHWPFPTYAELLYSVV